MAPLFTGSEHTPLPGSGTLSNKLSAFMMLIVDEIFARHIMNMHRKPPSTFMMWIVI
jgi:hypothetical protein